MRRREGDKIPGWLPYSVYISAYHVDAWKGLGSRKFVERLHQKYGGVASEDLSHLEFRTEFSSGLVRCFSEREFHIVLLAAGSIETERNILNSIPEYKPYDSLVENLREVLPEEPASAFTLRVAYATDEEEAGTILRGMMEVASHSLASAGLVRGCMFATIGDSGDASKTMPSRELLIVHYGGGFEGTSEAIWPLVFDISYLALHAGEMSRLYSERVLMFSQMEAAESNTQLRINEILLNMRRPVDEMQPDDLEEVLKEITIQYSRLSTLASSMRRDYVKAQGILRGLRNLLKRWNERPLGERLTNSSAMIDDFESRTAPFGDFIERTEALMAQLNTVLDSVRTYLGIKQQKMSIMEESSSKEQLIRLVNLQEILHKLEVLIVAVYLTEMAKVVFEALAHESANLLTALFIPLALIISILIGRLLHASEGH